MRFLSSASSLLAISLLTLTTALPAPSTLPAPPTESPATTLVQRQIGNGADCSGTFQNFFFQEHWQVHTWGPWLATDYGKGFLDNLRGQCGYINDWQFTYWADGSGFAEFYTSPLIRPHCVEDAIWLASSGSGAIGGVQCQID